MAGHRQGSIGGWGIDEEGTEGDEDVFRLGEDEEHGEMKTTTYALVKSRRDEQDGLIETRRGLSPDRDVVEHRKVSFSTAPIPVCQLVTGLTP